MSEQEILNARILIVDDQEADVLLLKSMLLHVGYRCVTSTMDPHAVSLLHRDNHYDLILLDLQMPGMDGFQIMESLKAIELDSYIPVLVISAGSNHRLRALAAGAKDFISKPFELMDILTRIHNMLEVRLLYAKLEESNKVLESLALHDALTGLPNRRLLIERLSFSIAQARRNVSTMAVVYLDLDGFKQINDTMGHAAGDLLLVKTADRLMAAVREEDTVARMGGDEFVIILQEINRNDGVDKPVSKILLSVSNTYEIQGGKVNVTASAGVSIYPTHGEDAETLIKSADLAMYEAKRTGKHGYRIAKSVHKDE